MSLFAEETTQLSAPATAPISRLAVAALVCALLGFGTLIGFPVAIVLGHAALIHLGWLSKHSIRRRGRALARAALAISYAALTSMVLLITAVLLKAYADLPSPHFF